MKLVRSKVPDIIRHSGRRVEIHLAAPGREADVFLRSKLVEEAQELYEATTKEEVVEEMADVLEVLEAFQRSFGITAAEIARVKSAKLAERGPFEDVILHEPYQGVAETNLCVECSQLAPLGQDLCIDCDARNAHGLT